MASPSEQEPRDILGLPGFDMLAKKYAALSPEDRLTRLIVSEALNMEQQRRLSLATRQVAELEQLASKSTIDELTALPNRRGLVVEYERIVRRFLSQRHGYSACVLYGDLDKFKEINDTFGHDVGDKVLVDFSNIARATLRPDDVFGRWGGDEFVGILPDTESHDAVAVANRLRQHVRLIVPGDGSIRPTLSMGVAKLNPDLSLEDNCSAADRLMYTAKRNGGDQVTYING